MTYQLLRDEKVIPTNEIIFEGLGVATNSYNKFVGRLEQNDINLMKWRYYKDGKAWLSKGEYKWITKRGTNKEKTIFWLSIWNGFFKVSFFFSNESRLDLLSLPISKETNNMIKNANAMGKTKKYFPIVFDIYDDKYLDDILLLAQFRKEQV